MSLITGEASIFRERGKGSRVLTGLALGAILVGLIYAYQSNYMLFHSLAEILSIVVGFGVFTIAWNTRRFLPNDYLKVIGVGYLLAGFVDLLHTLAYKDMNVFTGYGAQLTTQLWLVARYTQAVTLLAAPFFVQRRIADRTLLAAYFVAVPLLLTAVFSGHFPDVFLWGTGLTPFKIASEYVISGLVLAALFLFRGQRSKFEPRVYRLILLSLACTAASDVVFTLWSTMYDGIHMAGHLFKLAAFFFMYQAVIVIGLNAPFDLIFRDLKQAEDALLKTQDSLEDQVRERTGALAMALEKLQKSEVQYRRIVDTTREGIWGIGPDGLTNFVNDSMSGMLGYSPEELMGRSPGDFIFEDSATFQSRLEQLRANVSFLDEPRLRHKDGHSVWTLASVEPVFDNAGIYTGAIAIFSDISSRKAAEEVLRRYNDQLEEKVRQRTAELVVARDAAEAANHAKSAFLANMSHELRTPLNAILGFSHLMRHEPEASESQREKLDIINRSGEHLLRLINAVLEVAKIEAGRVRLDIAPFDLGSMVSEVTVLMRFRAEEKGLRLIVEQSPDVPRYIRGDEARIRQVLINLIGNAVKFTTRGGIAVRIGLKEGDPPVLQMEVEDTGPGIPEEELQRLFKPFVQLAASSVQQGTGLGLAISREFVQMMGGTIGVTSTVGRGSVFLVELPVAAVPENAVTGYAPLAATEVAGLAPGQAVRRVLIAEDQLENQMLLKELMVRIGVETKIAANGAECIRIFEEWRPDLIWMDWRMPVMDGVEATRRIRGSPGGDSVKIVGVTASVFKEQQQELFDAGMNDLVRKPYHFNEIYDALARQLGVQYIWQPVVSERKGYADADTIRVKVGALTPELREELRTASEHLDSDRLLAAVAETGRTDPELARTLFHLAENFDYPAILKALAAASADGEGQAAEKMGTTAASRK